MAWMTILGLDWKGGAFGRPLDIVDVPQKSGVFKLHTRSQGGDWEVIYVGQASNLYMTLLAYFGTIVEGDTKAAGINESAKVRLAAAAEVSFSYALVEGEKERAGSVRSLYDYYQPACNQPEHVPDVTDFACNPY